MHNPATPAATDRTLLIPTPGAIAAPMRAEIPPELEPLVNGRGLNPLINAANALLTVVVKLRSTLEHQQVPALHQRLTEEIKAFERSLNRDGVAPETVLTARYLLCSLVDEIVLNTPWGSASGWSQHSLLSLFHKETFGGEKCFVILQRLQEAPARHLDSLQLFYMCLSLGFEGKYRLIHRGHEQLEQIRDTLYQTIENHLPARAQDLSPHWQGCGNRQSTLTDLIPMWVFASVVLAVLLLSYSGFRWWLYDTTRPITGSLKAHLSAAPSITPATAPAAQPRP